jgi:hypothetical protein
LPVVGRPRHKHRLKYFGVRRSQPLARKAEGRAVGIPENISVSDYAVTTESFRRLWIAHCPSVLTLNALGQSDEKVGRFGLGYNWLQHDNSNAIVESWWKWQRINGEFQSSNYFSDKCGTLSKILNTTIRGVDDIREFRSQLSRNVILSLYFSNPKERPRSGLRYLDGIARCVRGYFGGDRGFASFGEGTPSSLEKTQGNESVDYGNEQHSPICNRGPLIPFLLGCLFFGGGCWLNYFYWGWLDDNCGRLGAICGLIFSGVLVSGLVLMFFVASACGAAYE